MPEKSPGSPGETGNPGKLFFAKVALDQTSQKLLLNIFAQSASKSLKMALEIKKSPRNPGNSRKSGSLYKSKKFFLS